METSLLVPLAPDPIERPDPIEWEGNRVAAAFDIERWNEKDPLLRLYFENVEKGVFCVFTQAPLRLVTLKVGHGNAWDTTLMRHYSNRNEWSIHCGHATTAETMARGLYRMGFEEECVWSQLPPLTAHEKLELRLTMPRKFWPLKWLREAS